MFSFLDMGIYHANIENKLKQTQSVSLSCIKMPPCKTEHYLGFLSISLIKLRWNILMNICSFQATGRKSDWSLQ